MKYIKFVKDHATNIFKEGDIAVIPKESLSAWEDSGYIKESSKKEFEAQKLSKEKAELKEIAKARKEHNDKTISIDVEAKKTKKK